MEFKNNETMKQQLLEMRRTYNEFFDSLIRELESNKVPNQKTVEMLNPERLMKVLKKKMFSEYDLQGHVTDVIKLLGIPANLKGYYYIREALIFIINYQDGFPSATKELYPIVAKKYGTTYEKVERAIRNAIEVAWERGNATLLKELFDTYGNRPTNSEFLALVADRIRMKVLDKMNF